MLTGHQLVVSPPWSGGRLVTVHVDSLEGADGAVFRALGVPAEACFLVGLPKGGRAPAGGARAGRPLQTHHVACRVRGLGGKGGFGALLRGMRSSVKTTDYTSCRDLSGRRLKTVQTEQRLKEWEAKEEERKAADKAAEEEARRKRREAKERVVNQALGDADAVARAAAAFVSTAVEEGAKKRKRTDVGADDFGEDSASEGDAAATAGPADSAFSASAPAPAPASASVSAPAPAPAPAPALAPAPPSEGDSGDEEASEDELLEYESLAELEKELGPEGLKAMLTLRGLKTGGTVAERAARLWAVRGKAKEEWDPSLFAGAKKRKKRKQEK